MSSEEYVHEANSHTPALIIYLLDVSQSMNEPLGGKRRIDVVSDALRRCLIEMMERSVIGRTVKSRYRVAMIAYSDQVEDLLGGVRTISEIDESHLPVLKPLYRTNTAAAFHAAKDILEREIPRMSPMHPAPLVCHMTDGEYNEADPEPIARTIMAMKTADGPVLVENCYMSDTMVPPQGGGTRGWTGITSATVLTNPYAEKLRRMSSPLPASYRKEMENEGYFLHPDAVMMLPGNNPELIELAFAMSRATPLRPHD